MLDVCRSTIMLGVCRPTIIWVVYDDLETVYTFSPDSGQGKGLPTRVVPTSIHYSVHGPVPQPRATKGK